MADFSFHFWYALFAPADVAAPIKERLAHALAAALAMPDVKEKFAAQAAVPGDLVLARFDAFFAGELERHAELVRRANARAVAP